MAFKPLIAALLAALLVAGCEGNPLTEWASTETVTVTAPQQSQTSTTYTTTAPSPTRDPSDLDPAVYQPLSEREFAVRVIRDPDSAIGHRIIIYGAVKQADAATGGNAFLAIVMGKPHAEHAYRTMAMITANDPSIIAHVVEGDQVTMYVECAGTYTYDTQFGGKTTVPLFRVNIINVTAHVDR